MPGSTPTARAARSTAAVFAFVNEGYTVSTGAFRSHVMRLVGFLQSFTGLSSDEEAWVDLAIEVACSGQKTPGRWLEQTRRAGTFRLARK